MSVNRKLMELNFKALSTTGHKNGSSDLIKTRKFGVLGFKLVCPESFVKIDVLKSIKQFFLKYNRKIFDIL